MQNKKHVSAIIVAAGKGKRMDSEIPKQYMDIAGKTILDTTLYKFEKSNDIDDIILVVNKEDMEYVKDEIAPFYNKIAHVVTGGKTRTESVYQGLKSVRKKCNIVLIHDGVRPFVSYNLINMCVENAAIHKACVPVIDVLDTIKEVSEDGMVVKTFDRKTLRAVQTPQAFDFNIIRECYENAMTEAAEFTDDASIVEYYGYKVKAIDGLYKNIKITTPLDLRMAEIIENIF
ncbi:MAG: 2-C-methyl-D-erythritol 4-phosphate cytidylyltransferase [Tissierellia bacterium]|jgi:2-C-methyl-D-erythritol 4-phosphate cytidylyltransferase|nr:2-C-methyl-D-erythritol 4-phosphate cytidylyltransferase [Tissierellia bacterium]MDD3226314.1 2-C-methyl-D-erythritol 4-phosphate cytidylyltransferase [Tissierellia bacterium]MDD3751761.1 2-C-methyl-D-erythritol 4-phosphate cytidylyltransferase [Tissierellia bacterium]MDD4045895.1 2-C-methyl-D-erythritol 4-phosphate cytidylyltransferase [Tissierellia bacterium]MDD4678089.1 2-C-methyl-D-erythritol 4-phosphate cytidylyltransferase [Tissierellia bacterium]